MNRSQMVNNIITGIIAGVSAGLILSALFYVQQYIDHKMERREQIGYIRHIVEDFQERILSAQQVASASDAPPPLSNRPEAVHHLRWAITESAYEEIIRTLEGRASTLTFDEKRQLLGAFGWYELFRPGGEFDDAGLLLGETQFHDIFDNLEAIKWLNVKIVDRTALGPRLP